MTLLTMCSLFGYLSKMLGDYQLLQEVYNAVSNYHANWYDLGIGFVYNCIHTPGVVTADRDTHLYLLS